MDDSRLERFADAAFTADGVAVASLEPGTTVVVCTRNSEYRVVTQVDPRLVLVQGGTLFPTATTARFEGATDGGSAVRMGWILVGFRMELWIGHRRIRSSPVESVTVRY
jgi:hypothetical protein